MGIVGRTFQHLIGQVDYSAVCVSCVSTPAPSCVSAWSWSVARQHFLPFLHSPPKSNVTLFSCSSSGSSYREYLFLHFLPFLSIIKLPVVWPSFEPAGWPCAAHPSPCEAASSPVAAGAAPRWRWHSRPGLQPDSPAAAALPPGTVTAPHCSYRWTVGSTKEGVRETRPKCCFIIIGSRWNHMGTSRCHCECFRMWEGME